MKIPTEIKIAEYFPDDHPRFPGKPTNLGLMDLKAHGIAMSDWNFYKSAVIKLYDEAVEAAKPPEVREAEEKAMRIAAGVGAGVLTAVLGTAIAYKFGRLHPNPSVYENATAAEAMRALGVLDDTDTDFLDDGEGIWIIDDVGGGSGGIPVFKLVFTQQGPDLQVEIHTPAQDAKIDAANTSWMSSELAEALVGGKMEGVQKAVMGKVASLKETATALLSGDGLQGLGANIKFYDQIWDLLDQALGNPKNADLITKALDAVNG